MSFRLVPNLVTLDDLERRNSPNRRVISTNSVAFGADYVKVVEDTPTVRHFLRRKCSVCSPKNVVFSGISLMTILQGSLLATVLKWGTPQSPLASENLTITWKRCKIGGKLMLITNRKSNMSFRLVPKWWPQMNFNGVIAVTLRYFIEFGKPAFQLL